MSRLSLPASSAVWLVAALSGAASAQPPCPSCHGTAIIHPSLPCQEPAPGAVLSSTWVNVFPYGMVKIVDTFLGGCTVRSQWYYPNQGFPFQTYTYTGGCCTQSLNSYNPSTWPDFDIAVSIDPGGIALSSPQPGARLDVLSLQSGQVLFTSGGPVAAGQVLHLNGLPPGEPFTALVFVNTPTGPQAHGTASFRAVAGGGVEPLARYHYWNWQSVPMSTITTYVSPTDVRVVQVAGDGSTQVTPGAPAGAPCFANCDNSTLAPILNVGDFACFLNRFAAADPEANCDGSVVPPVLNVADFACFLNKFAAGCS